MIPRMIRWLQGMGLIGLLMGALTLGLSAQSSATLSINSVDTSAFPQVVVNLARNSGSSTLSAADLQIFEDGLKVPAGSIELASGDAEPINFVLAVDISTEAADLERVKAGLVGFTEQMGPGDGALLLSFFDDVRVEQPLTTDLEALRTAIRGLTANGNYTALNRATIESINRADLFPAGSKTIVIVTDSVENLNTAAGADVISRAAESDLPIYLIAYSPKVAAPGVMDAFAQQINAQLSLVESATEAQLRLQTLSTGNRRGYQVRFLSSLPADGNEHTVSISLANGNAEDRADAVFRAQSGTVSIETPNLVNGQQVGGRLVLAPVITAPGPLRQVEFLLDGERLALVQNAPFEFAWDSSAVVPGSHVVGVRAEDSAGNRGETLLTLQVVEALQIAIKTAPESYYLGDEITVVADVRTLNGVASVQFLLDDMVVAEDNEAPFSFVLDSRGYTADTYAVSARAIDVTGAAETQELPLVLTPAPPRFLFSGQVWLRILAVLTIGLTLLLAWILLGYLALMARRQRHARFQLELQNMGNLPTTYLLKADEAKGALIFSFLLNGIPLRGRQITEWVAIPRERAAPLALTTTQAPAAQPVAPSVMRPAQAAPKAKQPSRPFTARFGEKASVFAGISHSFMGLLGALGSFLPASLGGRALQRASSTAGTAYSRSMAVYRLNQEVEDAQSALKEGQSTFQPVATMARPIAPHQRESEPQFASAPTMTMSAPAYAPQAAAAPTNGYYNGTNGYANGAKPNGVYTGGGQPLPDGVRYDGNGVAYRPVMRRLPDTEWTETTEIEPGEMLSLELVIEPKHSSRTREYPFRITSKPMTPTEHAPRLDEATVKVRGVSWVYWLLLPTLIVLAGSLIVLFMLSYLLVDLGVISRSLFELARLSLGFWIL